MRGDTELRGGIRLRGGIWLTDRIWLKCNTGVRGSIWLRGDIRLRRGTALKGSIWLRGGIWLKCNTGVRGWRTALGLRGGMWLWSGTGAQGRHAIEELHKAEVRHLAKRRHWAEGRHWANGGTGLRDLIWLRRGAAPRKPHWAPNVLDVTARTFPPLLSPDLTSLLSPQGSPPRSETPPLPAALPTWNMDCEVLGRWRAPKYAQWDQTHYNVLGPTVPMTLTGGWHLPTASRRTRARSKYDSSKKSITSDRQQITHISRFLSTYNIHMASQVCCICMWYDAGQIAAIDRRSSSVCVVIPSVCYPPVNHLVSWFTQVGNFTDNDWDTNPRP